MKNKWYRSYFSKGILVFISLCMSVIMMISLLCAVNYPNLTRDIIQGKSTSYESSTDFSDHILADTRGILRTLQIKRNFETKGKYNPDKIVDLETYVNDQTITNKNQSGIAFSLGDLREWAAAYDGNNIKSYRVASEALSEQIIVCLKPDSSYDYFYFDDFRKMIAEHDYHFSSSNEDESSFDILSDLEAGNIYANEYNYTLTEENGKIIYSNCWDYDGFWMEIPYIPDGAADYLEIANTNPKWNGRLNDLYQITEQALYQVLDDSFYYDNQNENLMTAEKSNLTYIYANLSKGKVYTNNNAYKDFDALDDSLAQLTSTGKYVIVDAAKNEFDSNIESAISTEWKHTAKNALNTKDDYIYAVRIDTSYPVNDNYVVEAEGFSTAAKQLQKAIPAGIVSTFVFLICLFLLTLFTGRRPEDEELHLNRFDHWKTGLSAAIVITVWGCLVAIVGNLLDALYTDTNTTHLGMNPLLYFAVGAVGVITCACFIWGWTSLVKRCKAHVFWKNSVIVWCWSILVRISRWLVEKIPAIWRPVVLFTLFIITQWMMVTGNGFFVVLGFTASVIAIVYFVRRCLANKRILAGLRRITSGDVTYKIPTDHLKNDQAEIAQHINSIGDGLDAALENSLKSERMKTALITNVSHDIKTPLTSIINYVDLLKKENFTDPKILKYLDILDEKSQRLKILTQDIVEASKVSSGNIELSYMKINLVEMIQQTSGEFEQKFADRGLHEILSLPDEPAIIQADGRRVWQVLENLYNNVAKYAMENTRIYADLEVVEDYRSVTRVVFSLKNVSAQPLNISADELTERFVRGDVSRSTEGSGLGLSIAKTLTERMGGTFELYLDGDLFKATISFPRVS